MKINLFMKVLIVFVIVMIVMIKNVMFKKDL